jgi:hypothetical protein
VLRHTVSSFPGVCDGEANDAVCLSGVTSDHLRLKSGLWVNRPHLDRITRNPVTITGFTA